MEFHREAWDLQDELAVLAVRLGNPMVKVIVTRTSLGIFTNQAQSIFFIFSRLFHAYFTNTQ
jgi:hypothetical protein